jgi:uncharacterized membrane protein
MSEITSKPPIRRADPTLQARTSKDSLRPLGLPRWLGLLLYGFFWVLLIIPLIRRWRRGPDWNRVRAAVALLGLIIAMGGFLLKAMQWPVFSWWLLAGGAVLALCAVVFGPLADPEKERKLQRRHSADYFLNGGRFVSGDVPGSPPLQAETPLYLLLKGLQLLLVPVEGSGDIHVVVELSQVAEIRVDGDSYLPIYLSEAKDPPVREERSGQSKTSVLELVTVTGDSMEFRYTGAFSKHLAETAAHAIYSVRKLADGVAGQSPEVFHIVGR